MSKPVATTTRGRPEDADTKRMMAKFKAFSGSAYSTSTMVLLTSKETDKLSRAAFAKFTHHDWFDPINEMAFASCMDPKRSGMMVLGVDSCNTYITTFAHEVAKKRTKNKSLDISSRAVQTVRGDLLKCIVQLELAAKDSKKQAADSQKTRVGSDKPRVGPAGGNDKSRAASDSRRSSQASLAVRPEANGPNEGSRKGAKVPQENIRDAKKVAVGKNDIKVPVDRRMSVDRKTDDKGKVETKKGPQPNGPATTKDPKGPVDKSSVKNTSGRVTLETSIRDNRRDKPETVSPKRDPKLVSENRKDNKPLTDSRRDNKAQIGKDTKASVEQKKNTKPQPDARRESKVSIEARRVGEEKKKDARVASEDKKENKIHINNRKGPSTNADSKRDSKEVENKRGNKAPVDNKNNSKISADTRKDVENKRGTKASVGIQKDSKGSTDNKKISQSTTESKQDQKVLNGPKAVGKRETEQVQTALDNRRNSKVSVDSRRESRAPSETSRRRDSRVSVDTMRDQKVPAVIGGKKDTGAPDGNTSRRDAKRSVEGASDKPKAPVDKKTVMKTSVENKSNIKTGGGKSSQTKS